MNITHRPIKSQRTGMMPTLSTDCRVPLVRIAWSTREFSCQRRGAGVTGNNSQVRKHWARTNVSFMLAEHAEGRRSISARPFSPSNFHAPLYTIYHTQKCVTCQGTIQRTCYMWVL